MTATRTSTYRPRDWENGRVVRLPDVPSLAAVGRELGITGQRAGELERNAFRKLYDAVLNDPELLALAAECGAGAGEERG